MHPDDSTVSFESLIRLLGGSTEHDEIAFLKVKAREMKHWTLMSSTLLEEAKLEMYSVSQGPLPIVQNVSLRSRDKRVATSIEHSSTSCKPCT